jgi:hypothetical protein
MSKYSQFTVARPGPNIPLNLPIIQELYSWISSPLFKRKSPIILKKADKNANKTWMTVTQECTCSYKTTER